MRPEVGRRVFVGTVMAGLPLIVGRTGLLAQGALAHKHTAAGADPVVDQIVRQIAMIHNSAQAGPRGAHARALAAQFRMLAVYQKQQRADDQARAAVREMVEREGRTALMYAEPDMENRLKALQDYGFQLDSRFYNVPLNATHAAREAVLDELLDHGLTPTYERLAATLEKAAGPLDRRRRRLVTIAQDQEWWDGFCAELWSQFQYAQLMALPWCLTARYFAWAAPACAAMEGGAMTLLIVYLVDC
jgi:hypothetical protein